MIASDLNSALHKIDRSFYQRDTIKVAQELLGQYIIHIIDGLPKIGRIVETEAYIGAHDLASHSSKGITPRTQIMYGPAGYAYIYLIYGMYYCMNIVTEVEGHGTAVLIRALEPILNISERTQGPGLLCKAMQIDKQLNGHDLVSGEDFFLGTPNDMPSFEIDTSARIGVAYAGMWADKPLRFYIKGNSFISRSG